MSDGVKWSSVWVCIVVGVAICWPKPKPALSIEENQITMMRVLNNRMNEQNEQLSDFGTSCTTKGQRATFNGMPGPSGCQSDSYKNRARSAGS